MSAAAAAVLLVLTATASLGKAPPGPVLPVLAQPISDKAPGRELKPASSTKAPYRVQAGVYRDAVELWISSTASSPLPVFEVSVHFPNAGSTAPGFVYRFGPAGKLPPSSENPPPPFALGSVQAAPLPKGLRVSIPARALPRFPTKAALAVDLCVKLPEWTNCVSGSPKDPLELPGEFRQTVGIAPHSGVVAVEATPKGWQGYDAIHHVNWVQAADQDLTVASLKIWLGREWVEAKAVGVNVPDRLALPDRRELVGLVSGKNPYETSDRCDPSRELRFSLYLIKGRNADQVLDWPAANCALGRAVSVTVDDEGALTVGYSHGAVLTFAWTTDHFERTEIGKR